MGENELVSHAVEMITAAAFITALAFAWIILRSSSWHILKHRLWRIAYGKDQRIDKQLKECVDEVSNLTSFRFHFVNAEHWPQARSIITWSKDNDIDLGSVCACGGFFNYKKHTIQKPPVNTRTIYQIYGIGLMVGAMFVALMISLACVSEAFVSFKDSGTWVLLGTSEARALFHSDARRLTKDDCSLSAQIDPSGTLFSKAEAVSLCEFFTKKTGDHFVAYNVKAQRIILSSLIALTISGLLYLRVGWQRVKAAWALVEYLEAKGSRADAGEANRLNDKAMSKGPNPLLRFERKKRGDPTPPRRHLLGESYTAVSLGEPEALSQEE